VSGFPVRVSQEELRMAQRVVEMAAEDGPDRLERIGFAIGCFATREAAIRSRQADKEAQDLRDQLRDLKVSIGGQI
jgi:hypothetical protein